jgi:hypothetical protein
MQCISLLITCLALCKCLYSAPNAKSKAEKEVINLGLAWREKWLIGLKFMRIFKGISLSYQKVTRGASPG